MYLRNHTRLLPVTVSRYNGIGQAGQSQGTAL